MLTRKQFIEVHYARMRVPAWRAGSGALEEAFPTRAGQRWGRLNRLRSTPALDCPFGPSGKEREDPQSPDPISCSFTTRLPPGRTSSPMGKITRKDFAAL